MALGARLVVGPYLELFARESKPGWDCWAIRSPCLTMGPSKPADNRRA